MPQGLDEATFEAALGSASMGVIDGPGMRVTGAQLTALVSRLPADGALRRARWIDLEGASIEGSCDLSNVGIEGVTDFTGTTFDGRADFNRAVFHGDARFAGAQFNGRAFFECAEFRDDVDFAEARFSEDAYLAGIRFGRARVLGPMLVMQTLSLGASVFEERVRIQVSAKEVRCSEAEFRAGVDLLVRWGTIVAEGVDFGAESVLGLLPPASETGMEPTILEAERPTVDARAQALDGTPALVSLRASKVAHLTLTRVDLGECRFAGAYGLDSLRMRRVAFDEPPGRRTRRQAIAEEHYWRGWKQKPRDYVDLDAAQVATLYRALRKGREDDKDAPGAGDLYYGEMEMRRQKEKVATGVAGFGVRHPSTTERWILVAYWLLSGYGLRASRALLALLVLVAALAVPLDLCGFDHDKGYWGALLFSVESSIGFLRPPTDELRTEGEVVQIALRLLGPLLFGLALLAVRSRVKR